MRLRNNPAVIEADAETWDPANPEPFKALAGDQFLTVDGDTALCVNEEGHPVTVYPGWLVLRPDGAGKCWFASSASPRGLWVEA